MATIPHRGPFLDVVATSAASSGVLSAPDRLSIRISQVAAKSARLPCEFCG